MTFQNTLEFAKQLDTQDELNKLKTDKADALKSGKIIHK